MESLAFELRRSKRRRTLAMRLLPDGGLRVLAPSSAPEREIRAWVASKAGWIEKQRARMCRESEWLAARRLADGGEIKVLGAARRICCVGEDALEASRILLDLPGDASQGAVRERLARLLEAEAALHFRRRCAAMTPPAAQPSLIGVKDWKSRWGACHRDGRIYLNWRLMLAPAEVADYVLAHELAHLRQPNHSPAFWREVARIMPGFEAPRRWLREEGWRLRLADE